MKSITELEKRIRCLEKEKVSEKSAGRRRNFLF